MPDYISKRLDEITDSYVAELKSFLTYHCIAISQLGFNFFYE
jgi:hypothetical protein